MMFPQRRTAHSKDEHKCSTVFFHIHILNVGKTNDQTVKPITDRYQQEIRKSQTLLDESIYN
jgi:hypothetical protein